jgi:succinyl-diaminopimelate desuccinylase
MEPSDAGVEAGCQGTVRAVVRTAGRRAHSARSWLGSNAIHALGPALARLAQYRPAVVEVDGLAYREGLNAVGVAGGVAGNVIPDEASLTVNYRFAPDKSLEDACDHVRAVFEGFDVEIVDRGAAARPGLDQPAARDFIAAVGAAPRPKFGWTDVARFSALGVPAVNFGPGDPALAHTRDEHVPLAQLHSCERALTAWLQGR